MHLPAKMAIWRKASDPGDPARDVQTSSSTRRGLLEDERRGGGGGGGGGDCI